MTVCTAPKQPDSLVSAQENKGTPDDNRILVA
jgi:hypothetical protein